MKRNKSVSIRTYLNNKYGVKPNGEPVVSVDELLAKANNDGKKTITLEVTPYSEEMVKNAEEILSNED
ncbi:hypothetical protein [Gimesia sp.]|uniref:hypothetical protein n=1 Tax=Gimesia sp. TaxID=2024833 RepID=UPI003A908BC4